MVHAIRQCSAPLSYSFQACVVLQLPTTTALMFLLYIMLNYDVEVTTRAAMSTVPACELYAVPT
jgi:hypothetical protein